MPYRSGSPRVFYRRWTSEAPVSVVLLLHGFGEHSGLYPRLAAELTRQGSEVWALDHIGHGLSDPRDRMFASVDQLAANAMSLLTEVQAAHPDLPCFLLGHSLGGLTAVAVAAERSASLAGVVLSGPPIAGLPADLTGELIFSLEPSYLDEIIHDPMGPASPQSVDNLWRAVAQFLPDLPARARQIQAPTFVVFGEHDAFVTPDQARTWAATLPNGRLWVVPGAYHDVLQDVMHRQVAAKICDFIAERRAAGPSPHPTSGVGR